MLGRFWEGFGDHVRCQEALKIEFKIWLDFLSIFLAIITDFWGLETLILTNTPREILVFQNSLSYRFFRFLSILEPMLASKTHPKFTKNPLKSYQKKDLTYDTFFYGFFTDFGGILGPKLRLCWDYVG